MARMTRALPTALALTLGLAAFGFADDVYLEGRFRSVEPGVTLQRGSDAGSEEAAVNLPFLPGDRVWTDDDGSAEIQFARDTQLHVDRGTKLEYRSQEGERTVLRLFSGDIVVRASRQSEFTIEAGGNVVDIRERGAYGIVLAAGETRLSVYDGEATLQADRRVSVSRGERVYAERGRITDGPDRFDARDDEAGRWADERDEDQDYGANRDYLPAEVADYAPELESHGSWYYEVEVGHVWRPSVSIGWSPYTNGHWAWTAYGWTWVPVETWGWAPFHYGRWDNSATLGWYWIPGRVWGPAWVSWSIGGSYVGWCPLGRYDRPVLVYRGHGVNRGEARAAWTYSRQAELGSRNRALRRTQLDPGVAVQVVAPRARLTRDLRVTEVAVDRAALRRGVKTRPTIGDTVPELRTDPATTIPVRRRQEGAPLSGRSDGIRPRTHATDRVTATGDRDRHEADAGVKPERSRERHPTDSQATTERGRRDDATRTPRVRDESSRGTSDPDRDVLRRLFRPVGPSRSGDDDANDSHTRSRSETRDRSGSQAESRSERREPRAEPRSEPQQRAEPRREPRSEPQQRAEPRREPRSEPRSEPRRSEPRSEKKPPPPASDQRDHNRKDKQ